MQIWNDKAEIRRHSFKASYYADLDGHSCLRFVVLKDFHFWGCCYNTYLLMYYLHAYSYKLFTLDSFLHYMLPQHSKAHMHTPILIFFTCIAKKQISKLHNIVLLHKKVKHVPKKIHLCTEIFRPPLYWSYVYIWSTFLEKIHLPPFIHLFFFFQTDTRWTNPWQTQSDLKRPG